MENALISLVQLVPPLEIALVKFTQLVKIHMLFSEMLKSLKQRRMMELKLKPIQVLMPVLILVTSSADSITFYQDTTTELMCD